MDKTEAKEWLEMLGITDGDGGLASLIRATYRVLGLRTYYTTGEKETRAWTILAGMTAPLVCERGGVCRGVRSWGRSRSMGPGLWARSWLGGTQSRDIGAGAWGTGVSLWAFFTAGEGRGDIHSPSTANSWEPPAATPSC